MADPFLSHRPPNPSGSRILLDIPNSRLWAFDLLLFAHSAYNYVKKRERKEERITRGKRFVRCTAKSGEGNCEGSSRQKEGREVAMRKEACNARAL